MNNNLPCWHPAYLIATFFGIGKIPVAPGTFGSLAGFLYLFIVLQLAILSLPGGIKNILAHAFATSDLFANSILIFLFSFIIGTWAAGYYSKKNNKEDPKEVVIDEVIGQALVSFFTFPGFIMLFENSTPLAPTWVYVGGNLFISFILFRLFDILKPWPINWFDKNIKGGLGIMLDDIVAAIMAIIMYYAILFLLKDAIS